eukprot:m51a1_g4059 putative endoglucanase precursor (endo- -beta-glucanase) (916) ;mRNA; f:720223-731819
MRGEGLQDDRQTTLERQPSSQPTLRHRGRDSPDDGHTPTPTPSPVQPAQPSAHLVAVVALASLTLCLVGLVAGGKHLLGAMTTSTRMQAEHSPSSLQGRVLRLGVSLEDAYRGARLPVSFSRQVQCPHCRGTGAQSPQDIVKCPVCHGEGVVRKSAMGMPGVTFQMMEKHSIVVDIPQGTPDGHQIVFAGEDDQDPESGAFRDLLVVIQVQAEQGANITQPETVFHYTYPTEAEVDYFVSNRGMNLLRIPFRWERLQRTLGADFDQTEQSRFTGIINYATSKGAHVLLDPHNYARYNGTIIGSANLPNELFVDFWTRLANLLKDNSKVIFGMMNEPNTMPTEQWFSAAKAAYIAIRNVTKTHLITIPGNAWTGAHSWMNTGYGGKTNADGWDAAGFPKDANLMVELHQYLDNDFSGSHEQCEPAAQQSKNLEGFTAWARQRGLMAVLGEIGAGNNSNCQAGIEAMLNYMEQNSDVWYGWSWWAAGPWWGPYFMTLEGTPGNDKPQMAWLLPHLNKGSVDPITPPTDSGSTESSASTHSSHATPLQLTGVSLASAEFGNDMPGTYNKDYTYPTKEEVDYFVSNRGMNLLRIPFRWERLQRTLGADFDQTEQSRLTAIVNYATSKGAHVLLDPHNYARYNGTIIGSAGLPNAMFVDFWTRLANLFKGDVKVAFGMMNEPNTMPTEQWFSAAKAAYIAIRTITTTHLITIPGNAWTGALGWQMNWYGKSNAESWVAAGFPKDANLMVEVHQYLDQDHSGSHEECDPAAQQTKNLEGFTAWARQHGLRAVLGEIGAGNNSNCRAGIEAMLNYMEQNSDVWYGWSWWAAGPWWGPYFMTLEGTPGNDKPQMAWLLPHLHKGSVDPIPPTGSSKSGSSHKHASSSSRHVASSTQQVASDNFLSAGSAALPAIGLLALSVLH